MITAPIRQSGSPLTIAIYSGLKPGTVGGVEQAVVGTVAALGRLTDGDERYIVVTGPADSQWLDTYVGPNTHVVTPATPLWRRHARQILRPVLPELYTILQRRAAKRRTVVTSSPFIDALQPDVVHFPFQQLYQTRAPSIFNPQDVQHVHLPEFFDAPALAFRRRMYPLWCRTASVVEVPSEASRDDLVRHLGVPREKILVIPKAAPTSLATAIGAPTLARVRAAYHLPDGFLFFPAQTWPHKNHIRLFEALACLRDRHDLRLPLVCTGRQNEFWPTIKAKLRELDLTEQVRFLGFIPADHVRAMYHFAETTVFPTLFEGGGLPVLEAFQEGSPLACSDLPVLTEQAGDAALFFDPRSSDDIARALMQLHSSPALRSRLRNRGKERAAQYSWHHTAKIYRALYRKLGGRPLTDEDSHLLIEASGGRTSADVTDRVASHSSTVRGGSGHDH